jgi:hypothetical protein
MSYWEFFLFMDQALIFFFFQIHPIKLCIVVTLFLGENPTQIWHQNVTEVGSYIWAPHGTASQNK